MYRRLAVALAALLGLAACGTPDPATLAAQTVPTEPAAMCKNPVSYPGPGTPLPTAS